MDFVSPALDVAGSVLRDLAVRARDTPPVLFEVPHVLLIVVAVKRDILKSAAAKSFHQDHPFVCWLISLLTCYAGAFLGPFLLGQPLLQILARHEVLIYVTVCWYLVFYFPRDIVSQVAEFLPIFVPLSLAREIFRVISIAGAVSRTQALHPSTPVIVIILGVCSGCGAGYMKTFIRLLHGVWTPTTNEFLHPGFYTKLCIFSSTLFTLQARGNLIIDADVLLGFVLSVFCFVKVVDLIVDGGHPDVIASTEKGIGYLLLGGIWSTEAAAQSSPSVPAKQRKINNNNKKEK